jgi:uncharacterized protein (DUF2249 family)
MNNDIKSLNDSKDSMIVVNDHYPAPLRTVRKEVSLNSLSKQQSTHNTFHKKKRSVDLKKNTSIINSNSVAHSRMFPSTSNFSNNNEMQPKIV